MANPLKKINEALEIINTEHDIVDAEGNLHPKTNEEPCWLCGDPEIFESGLCYKDYWWAEENTPADASEDQIRFAYYTHQKGRKLWFWIVTKATPNSTIDDIAFITDAQGLIRQARGGLNEDDIVLVTLSAKEANEAAKKQLEIARDN